jgi:hypothetical protein
MMKLLTQGILLAVPSFLLTPGNVFAQYPVAAAGETHATAPAAATEDPPPPTAVPGSPGTAYVPLTAAQKAVRRARRMVEPLDLLSSALGAGFEQWRNVPREWGQGIEGYGRRFGSSEGYTASDGAVGLAFDIGFHLDPRYRRMPQARFGARLWNAVSQTFVANKDSGGRTVNISEIAGNFGAGFISNTWEPRGYNATGDALTRGALGLAYHALKNVAREFLPSPSIFGSAKKNGP